MDGGLSKYREDTPKVGKVWGKRKSREEKRGVWFGYIKFGMPIIYIHVKLLTG